MKNTDYILLDEILEARRTIPVDFEIGGVVKTVPVTYNPSAFTPELEAKINADKSDTLGDSFVVLLEPLFVDWSLKLPPLRQLPLDVVLEDLPKEEQEQYLPRDFPPTGENLRKLPFGTLSIFIKKIMEDIVPKKESIRR